MSYLRNTRSVDFTRSDPTQSVLKTQVTALGQYLRRCDQHKRQLSHCPILLSQAKTAGQTTCFEGGTANTVPKRQNRRSECVSHCPYKGGGCGTPAHHPTRTGNRP